MAKLDIAHFERRLDDLRVKEKEALIAYGEWAGARQECEITLMQLREAEQETDGLAGLREILPPETRFANDPEPSAAAGDARG